jgi:hypothetical protein
LSGRGNKLRINSEEVLDFNCRSNAAKEHVEGEEQTSKSKRAPPEKDGLYRSSIM